MAQSLSGVFIHLIFSTKNRLALISPQMEEELYAHIGGIIQGEGCRHVALGGTADHMHCLLWLKPTESIAEIVRRIKGNSSRWVNQHFPNEAGFSWQAGYGAFSVSASHLPKVRQYIREQEKHHQKLTYQEEFIALLDRYGINYDEKHLWT
ncbi:MAG: IS200/IS605 family transposase [Alphaproteobacteria bacterium]